MSEPDLNDAIEFLSQRGRRRCLCAKDYFDITIIMESGVEAIISRGEKQYVVKRKLLFETIDLDPNNPPVIEEGFIDWLRVAELQESQYLPPN